MSKAKPRKKRSDRKGRYCLRCGCEQKRACPGGCAWAANADVCTACLSEGERLVFAELVIAYNSAKGRERVQLWNRIETFERYLEETSMDMSIPFVVTEKGNKRAAPIGAAL